MRSLPTYGGMRGVDRQQSVSQWLQQEHPLFHTPGRNGRTVKRREGAETAERFEKRLVDKNGSDDMVWGWCGDGVEMEWRWGGDGMGTAPTQ